MTTFDKLVAGWLLIEIILAIISFMVPFLIGYWLGGRRYRKLLQEDPAVSKFIRSLDVPRL